MLHFNLAEPDGENYVWCLCTMYEDAIPRTPWGVRRWIMDSLSRITTCVYFIQAGANGPVKIGTAIDPRKRLYTLQVANYERLEIVARVPGYDGLESCIHNALDEHRIRGEWFRPAPEVMAWVERAARCHPWFRRFASVGLVTVPEE